MSKSKRRRLREHDQTDSRSRKLHKAAAKGVERLYGVALFMSEASEQGGSNIVIVEDIDYEAARSRARDLVAFKWVARPLWDEHRRAGAEASGGLEDAATEAPGATFPSRAGENWEGTRGISESIARGFFGCPACTVFNPITFGCDRANK